MSVTGVILTYERQILAWAERPSFPAPSPGAERLPLEALVAAATLHRPELEPPLERMLSDDRSSALATADACRRIPWTIVRWKPLARAWIAAKGGRRDNPETDRSNHIADVFERLTGHDLRRHYDDSADF
jgi:hypothetical protein